MLADLTQLSYIAAHHCTGSLVFLLDLQSILTFPSPPANVYLQMRNLLQYIYVNVDASKPSHKSIEFPEVDFSCMNGQMDGYWLDNKPFQVKCPFFSDHKSEDDNCLQQSQANGPNYKVINKVGKLLFYLLRRLLFCVQMRLQRFHIKCLTQSGAY